MQRLKNDKVVKAEKFGEDKTASSPSRKPSKTSPAREAQASVEDAVQDIYVAYDLPIVQTVQEFERIEGGSEAIFSVQVMSRVSGYMTHVKFKDGDLVKAGDLLFQIDPRQYKAELDRAEGNLQQMEAHKVRLEKEYHRAKNLIERGSISPEEFDRYESDLKETEAGVKLAKANRDLAQLNYDWCEVRASTSGRLSRRMVDPGSLVKADATVLTSIVSLDPIYVYFDVHEQTMLRIKHLMQQGKVSAARYAEFRSRSALPMKPTTSFRTRASSTSPTTGSITTGARSTFRAKLDNKDHLLNPGLFVRVRLPIGDAHQAVMIRERALAVDHKEWTASKSGKGRLRPRGPRRKRTTDQERRGRQRKRGPGSSSRLEQDRQPRRACATDSWKSKRACARATGWWSAACSD